jgi:acrylyl-CoA reductase (NADPH)
MPGPTLSKMSETFDAYVLEAQGPAGVDSVLAPAGARIQAWHRLGTDLPLDKLDAISCIRRFAELPEQILAGAIQGRTIVDIGR